MPRRSQADDLAWPPIGDDLPVVDLHGPSVPAVPATRRRTPPAPARAPVEVTPPVAREASVFERGRRLPPGIQAATAALLVVIAVATAILVARAGGENPAAVSEAGAADVASPTRRPEPPVPARTASLSIRTDPPGAVVFVNARRVGVTPVTVPSVEAGEHEVVIRHGGRTIRHTAHVEAGESVALVVPIPDAGATAPALGVGGSIRILAPVELRVTREGRLLGTSEMARIPLAPGTHTVLLSSEAVGYQATRTVVVAAGRTTTIEVDMPEQPVAINAIPWAEVIVDGRPVGETPLGTLTLPVGPHTIVLRHPRLGERTLTTVVRAGEPVRLSVDLRQ